LKKFLLHIALFALVTIGLNALLSVFRNPYWANEPMDFKRQQLDWLEHRPNALLVGSSRFYRQLDPRIIDQTLAEQGTKTYNLATPGQFNPENYFNYEHLLNDRVPELSVVFLELAPLRRILDGHETMSRVYYWHNWRYTLFSIRYLLESGRSGDTDTDMIVKHVISFVYYLADTYFSFNPQGLPEARFSAETWQSAGPRGDGYYSLNDEMTFIETAQPKRRSNVYRRRSDRFVNNHARHHERTEKIRKEYRRGDYSRDLVLTHLDMLRGLIRRSEEAGIRLFLVIPPRISNEAAYRGLLAIKEQLPPGNVIDLGNPDEHPELYALENAFDRGHLNTDGSRKLSLALAQAAKQLLDQSRP
jgi:hypothetical protein